MAGKYHHKSKPIKGGIRNLMKTVAMLAAATLLETTIQKAAENPRVHRKAKALGKALQGQARVA
jgi:hypothetical protein